MAPFNFGLSKTLLYSSPVNCPTVDPYFSNVSLLMPMNGANGSTTFIDVSNNSYPITRVGNPVISTTQSVFGGSSAYFPGTGKLQANSAAGSFGTGDFTVEFWAYWTGINPGGFSWSGLCCTARGGFAGGWYIAVDITGGNTIWYLDGTSGVLATTMPINTWVYVAVVRQGTAVRLYLNGVKKVEGTSTSNLDSSNFVNVGGDNGTTDYLNGYVDDLRITKGVARYTSDFTPPSCPFPISYGFSGTYGAIPESDGIACYNNVTYITINEINNYGVVRIGLNCGCGLLTNTVSLLQNPTNLAKIQNYIQNGGVVWFNTEWYNGDSDEVGCSSKANANTILQLLGTEIRQLADSPIYADLTRSNDPAVIASNFPSVLWCDATATFTGGTLVYGYTGPDYFGNPVVNARLVVYEKIGNGILYVSGDVNSWDNGVYTEKLPNQFYTSLRALVANT